MQSSRWALVVAVCSGLAFWLGTTAGAAPPPPGPAAPGSSVDVERFEARIAAIERQLAVLAERPLPVVAPVGDGAVETAHVRRDAAGTDAALARAIGELAAAVRHLRAPTGAGVAPRPLNLGYIEQLVARNAAANTSRVDDVLMMTEAEVLEQFGRPTRVLTSQSGRYLEYTTAAGKLTVNIQDGRVVGAHTAQGQ